VAMQAYRKWYPSEGMSLVVVADFSQASSPINGIWLHKNEPIPGKGDDRWFGTPFQVADARHYPAKAFTLIKNWNG